MRYVVRQDPVEAMQYDSSQARAHEILAWVYRNNGTGAVDGTDPVNPILTIGPTNTVVSGNDYVIRKASGVFEVRTESNFSTTYESVGRERDL